MVKRIVTDSKVFARLNNFIKPHEAKGRTESAAMLIWFLETIYRLDEIAAQDAVCDRKHDAGLDALAVNDEQREVVVFQAVRRMKATSTLGDTDLKEFVGSLKQLESEESILRLILQTQNPELRTLLEKNKVAEKIKNGYTVRPIFVTNVAANHDATAYLRHAEAGDVTIDLWDQIRLTPILDQLSKEWFVKEEIKLRINDSKLFFDGPKTNPRLVYAAVRARELVRLPGIEDTRVFAQNVRLGLGDTRVNQEITTSVQNKNEHSEFLTFHNGLTIVAKELRVRGNTLTLNSYSVCNGCQSLLTFYRNRKSLTDNLEVLVRIVRVGDDRRLPESISYRTNNQNAISLRDLSANDTGQIRLKAEFDELYAFDSTYIIKRGEGTGGKRALHNEYAGRLLLALYVRQPWASHQKYRVFGDLENQIFGYDRTAAHIRLAQLLDNEIDDRLEQITNERVRKYGLTKFLILYLAGEILRTTSDGITLLNDPALILSTTKARNKRESKTMQLVGDIVDFVITELNYYFGEHGGDAYDYKSEFKTPGSIQPIRNEVLKAYEKDAQRKRIDKFKLP